ncbi:hypothetical protein OG943_15525 [Amycolatopsis sp. NBC_00345]|uniref:hypothetical protein n=1 Tax=Amycolatopsis sp. NBC_00345 TaxID=2975955 RepID=UPI002E26C447
MMVSEPGLDIPEDVERFLIDLSRHQIMLGGIVSSLFTKYETGALSAEDFYFSARRMHNFVDGCVLHAAKIEGASVFVDNTYRVPLALCPLAGLAATTNSGVGPEETNLAASDLTINVDITSQQVVLTVYSDDDPAQRARVSFLEHQANEAIDKLWNATYKLNERRNREP